MSSNHNVPNQTRWEPNSNYVSNHLLRWLHKYNLKINFWEKVLIYTLWFNKLNKVQEILANYEFDWMFDMWKRQATIKIQFRGILNSLSVTMIHNF